MDNQHICAACGYDYEENNGEGLHFHRLPEDWNCPDCGLGLEMFHHYSCWHFVAELANETSHFPPFSLVQIQHIHHE